MNAIFLLGFGGPTEWIIILAVVFLLFGGSKLPQLAKALGQSKRAFKEGLDEADEEARQKQLKAQQTPPSTLAAVDDEALFEEARRRAQAMRANDVKRIEK